MSVLSVIKPTYVSHVFIFVSMGCLCVSDGDISTKDHSTHLHATGQTEDTLAYNDNGWLGRMPFSQTLMLKQAMRRICGYLSNRSIRAR